MWNWELRPGESWDSNVDSDSGSMMRVCSDYGTLDGCEGEAVEARLEIKGGTGGELGETVSG